MKQLLCVVLTLLSFHLHAADYYWVGGTGNWSDLNHWRLGSSAGPIPSIVPSSADNVFFDAGSGFTAASKTVTLNANGFCKNMTWGNVPNSPLFVTANAAFNVQVSGNASLSPTTTYNILFAFKDTTAATLTTNGAVLGQFGIEIDKASSSLTVTDSLIVPSTAFNNGTNLVLLTSGTFDIAGKKVKIYSFSSDNNNVRTLEMTNTTLAANSGTSSAYHYTGTGKTLNAAGSTVIAFGYWADGGTYNKVTVTSGNGVNTIRVNNATFSSLTFTPSAGVLFSSIGSNNNVDTLLFNGMGNIGYNFGSGNLLVSNNNTVGIAKFTLAGQMYGTGNVIGRMECLDNLLVNPGSNNNTVDSLILAPNHPTRFWGTFNINDYLSVAGAPCEAYTEISGDSVNGTVNFAPGAAVDISNVILTGIKATGPVTPIAMNGIDGGGNAGFTITEPSGSGTTLYWVGGSGDWNEKAHWSFSSGGAGGACVPFKNDNVVFDAGSGLAGGTVTTSSSSFCKDITWASGVGATTFNENSSYLLRVYGSAVLQPTVTYNAVLDFYGSSAATLTTNGGGGGTASFAFNVVKTDTGSVTLMDNWINTANAASIGFVSGGLNMANRTVTCLMLSSENNLARNLDISNATITTRLRWVYMGGNKSITATGSHITTNGTFRVNSPGSTYPWVDITQLASENVYDISGTTFGQLTFTNTSATSAATILSGNTIRRLEFKGAGAMGSTGNNTIDSLLLAGSRSYIFRATNTIAKYMKAEAVPCSGLTEIRSGNGTATLAFQPTADVHIDNVYLQSIAATGAMTPIALDGADAGGNTGWSFTPIAGGARYWVGGAGDWNESNHWSTSSGGAPGACVPTVSNDVYFDAGSGFTAASKTVTVNNGNAYCRNVNWTGAANAPIWSKAASWNIEVWGDSLILNPAATFNAAVILNGTNVAFLKSTVLGNFDIYINKPGSSLTLLNNYANAATDIGLVTGAFNAPGRSLTVSGIDNNGYTNNVFAIDISNANITAGTWRFIGTIANHTLNAANSTIITTTFAASGLQYDTVYISGAASANSIMNSTTINKLTFTNASSTSTAGINGVSNTLGTVEYKGSGGVYGTGNTINTLMFFPGKIYTFTAGTTTNITGDWFASGTPCNLTEIVSSSTTANATINKTGGAPEFDYIRVRRITGSGATPFVGFNHTIDLGSNTNWSIAPYNGASPIYGLGPDTAIVATAFPYVLHTDGFFGAPSSQYTWNNSSTADSLIVSDTGTYSVSVTFPDGCSISDTIHIGLQIPLPVTLNGFSAAVQNCQTYLNWEITGATAFKYFTVEKSKDGRSFDAIGNVAYAEGVYTYSYADRSSNRGTAYYRLKLMDADGTHQYGTVVSTTSDCEKKAIEVYPTLTKGIVYMNLPAGYEQARIEVFNYFGQLLQSPRILKAGQSGLNTIRFDGLAQGQYLLKVSNGKEVQTFKVIYQL